MNENNGESISVVSRAYKFQLLNERNSGKIWRINIYKKVVNDKGGLGTFKRDRSIYRLKPYCSILVA